MKSLKESLKEIERDESKRQDRVNREAISQIAGRARGAANVERMRRSGNVAKPIVPEAVLPAHEVYGHVYTRLSLESLYMKYAEVRLNTLLSVLDILQNAKNVPEASRSISSMIYTLAAKVQHSKQAVRTLAAMPPKLPEV